MLHQFMQSFTQGVSGNIPHQNTAFFHSFPAPHKIRSLDFSAVSGLSRTIEVGVTGPVLPPRIQKLLLEAGVTDPILLSSLPQNTGQDSVVTGSAPASWSSEKSGCRSNMTQFPHKIATKECHRQAFLDPGSQKQDLK